MCIKKAGRPKTTRTEPARSSPTTHLELDVKRAIGIDTLNIGVPCAEDQTSGDGVVCQFKATTHDHLGLVAVFADSAEACQPQVQNAILGLGEDVGLVQLCSVGVSAFWEQLPKRREGVPFARLGVPVIHTNLLAVQPERDTVRLVGIVGRCCDPEPHGGVTDPHSPLAGRLVVLRGCAGRRDQDQEGEECDSGDSIHCDELQTGMGQGPGMG